MPAGKIRRRRRVRRRPRRNAPKYRNAIARIPRQVTYKHKQVIQKVVYHNNFICDPQNNGAGNQQNWFFRICLNSPFLFEDGYSTYATLANQQFTPNKAITSTGAGGSVGPSTTIMPGLKDGYAQFSQFAKYAVLGTKVSLTATPIENSNSNQPAVLYAVKHSQTNSGLSGSSTIDDINKLPFRKMVKVLGPAPASGVFNNRPAGAKMVIKHSPKKFNSVYGSLKTNNDMWGTTSGDGSIPNERDHLTIGIIPMLNTLGQQATKFGLQMRVEQSIMLTEPLEAINSGGNFALPKPISQGYGRTLALAYGAAMYALPRRRALRY
jgi:hypothetical protein